MKRLLIVISFIAFVACSKWGLDTEWKSGKFRLIAVDTDSQMCLIHEDSPIALVEPTIFAVGSNEKYIILKRHPAKDQAASDFDRSVTRYFIVGRDQSVRGPLTREEFETLRTSLALPSFSKIFENLK